MQAPAAMTSQRAPGRFHEHRIQPQPSRLDQLVVGAQCFAVEDFLAFRRGLEGAEDFLEPVHPLRPLVGVDPWRCIGQAS